MTGIVIQFRAVDYPNAMHHHLEFRLLCRTFLLESKFKGSKLTKFKSYLHLLSVQQ